jgi:hypothetical protein
LVKHAKIMFENYEETGTVSSQFFQQYEEKIDLVTTSLDRAMEIQKNKIEHLHQVALRVSLSKSIAKDGMKLANKALQNEIAEKEEAQKKVHSERQNLYQILDSLPIAFHLQASDHTAPFANKVFSRRIWKPSKKALL